MRRYLQTNDKHIREMRAKRIKLGLDLQGGMRVVLEVNVLKMLEELAKNKDDQFNTIAAEIEKESQLSEDPVTDIFKRKFDEKQIRLSRYYGNLRETNDEIIKRLQDESEKAVDRGMEILRNRVDQYGVSEPSIQKEGARRIIVELPGVSNEAEVTTLIQGTALPARLVALGVELGQRRRAGAHRGQGHGFLGIGHRLGHDAVGAIGQLVDAPELFGSAGKGGNRHNFTVGGCGQRAIGAGDLDFEIGRAGIAAGVGDGRDGPLLMGPDHVVEDVERRCCRPASSLNPGERLIGSGVRAGRGRMTAEPAGGDLGTARLPGAGASGRRRPPKPPSRRLCIRTKSTASSSAKPLRSDWIS